MQQIIEIYPGSEAFEKLKDMIRRAEAGNVRISLTLGGRGGVQLKCGGGTWTTALSSGRPESPKSEPCGDPLCPCS